MKILRAGAIALAGLMLTLLVQSPARAEVRTIAARQALPQPTAPAWEYFGLGVAIDGPHIIVLAANVGEGSNTYAALLYRRNADTGAWVYRRTLVTATGSFYRTDVRMKNGIAAVQLGGQVSLFEYSGGDYRPAPSAAPIHQPGGVAISGNSVLIGGNNCDVDGVIYQKGAGGIWGITGRIDDNLGGCRGDGVAVDLYYDTALLRIPFTNRVSAWRRNGTALDWVPAGNMSFSVDTPTSHLPFVSQKGTAVGPSSVVFRNNGNGWIRLGDVTPDNYGNGAGMAFETVYRDGLLVTAESVLYAQPYVYVETSPGFFSHVATLNSSNITTHHDVSGRTVVAAIQDRLGTGNEVEVFELPTQVVPPAPIVNDFEDASAAEFTFNSGAFALATRGGNDVLAQSNTSNLAIALVEGSDWTDYQRVTAQIAPTFAATGGWVGLVARYVDANNYYYAALRGNDTLGLYKRVNGVDTLLREATTYPLYRPARVSLVVDGDEIGVWIDNFFFPGGSDRSLTRGRAGLATWQTRADFDDVHVAGADVFVLLEKDYSPFSSVMGREFSYRGGGSWQVVQDEFGNNTGFSQSNLTNPAFAFIGAPVRNQEITARVRLDAFGTSQTGAWYGLLARYQDERNHYYVTMRGTNQLQIRKQVNGVITVLASMGYEPEPGVYHELRFHVINDQLHLFMDGEKVLSAHDAELESGRFGLATYRAAATWNLVTVIQP